MIHSRQIHTPAQKKTHTVDRIEALTCENVFPSFHQASFSWPSKQTLTPKEETLSLESSIRDTKVCSAICRRPLLLASLKPRQLRVQLRVSNPPLEQNRSGRNHCVLMHYHSSQADSPRKSSPSLVFMNYKEEEEKKIKMNAQP